MRRNLFPSLALAGLLAAGLSACTGDDPKADDPNDGETTGASTDDATAATSDDASDDTSDEPSDADCPPADHSREEELITLEEPAECATVSGTFTASGTANSFEATVPWRILDADGNDMEVEPGFATAEGWLDSLYPWESEIDVSGLAPGTYVFEAQTADPSDGEGNPPEFVRATIVVE